MNKGNKDEQLISKQKTKKKMKRTMTIQIKRQTTTNICKTKRFKLNNIKERIFEKR